MDIKIRSAEITDAGPISDILVELGWFPDLEKESPSKVIDRIRNYLEKCDASDSNTVYVAEINIGVVVGYVSAHWIPYFFFSGPEGYISELFVRASMRGIGIGTNLLARIQADADQRGCSRLMLINNRKGESYKKNFYRKCGWTERDQIANFVYQLKP